MKYEPTTLPCELSVKQLYAIHYFEYTSDFSFCGESHDFWEFLYVDKGEVIVRAGERELTLQKDEIIFHQPNEFHSVCANKTVAPNLIVVSFDCCSPCMDLLKERILTLTKNDRLLLAQIVAEAECFFSTPLNDPWTRRMEPARHPPFGCGQMIRLYLEQLLLQLIRRCQPAPLKAVSGTYVHDSQEEVYRRVLLYLEKHLPAQLTLEQICQDNLISYSQLARLFHEKHGCSVMKFFSDMKLDTAKQLIRARQLNITQIADALGYSSIHYFSRHFKKLTGMTPTEYAASVKMLCEMPPP